MSRLMLLAACGCVSGGLATAADWPQYAYNAAHSAASPEPLPANLHVQWQLDLPRLKPAWPDQSRLNYDATYRPLIVAGRVIVASPGDDSLAAYELGTGKQSWRFFAGGPFRVPPASDGARIFAGADDGWLYALGVDRGNVLWKMKAAPQARLILGNGRLIDTWCVRGGPAVADGRVYFAAGIWPFMGVFIHCLDAATGKPVWSNSGEGDAYMVQPHGAASFGGIAPQGTLVVAGEHVLVPGGRTLPACYDRRTGKRQYFMLATQTGDHEVGASDKLFFCAGAAYDLSNGNPVHPAPKNPVLSSGTLYGLGSGTLLATDLASLSSSGATAIPFPGGTVVIQAGRRLYAGGKEIVAAWDLPLRPGKPPSWQMPLEGTVGAMAAGCGRLVLATEEGRVYCLGPGSPPAGVAAAPAAPTAVPPPPQAALQRADALLGDSACPAGYAVLTGAGSGDLARALAARSSLDMIVLEPDAGKAQSLRAALQGMGLYGQRIAVCVGDVASLSLPPYFASLVVVQEGASLPGDAWCARLFHVLHPYRGRAYLRLSGAERQSLAHYVARGTPGKATLGDALGMTRLLRTGGLPGAGNWTHEHADAANTRVSADVLVKAPLGLLWFGGSSHEGVLPRHGHGPQPQVLDGRLVVEKVDGLRSMDIYAGRILWEADVPGFGAYYNNTAHQYGANGTGTNYISTPDAVYARYFRECLRFDPATGRPLPSISLPKGALPGAGDNTVWGYLNVVDDYLVGGVATPDRPYSPAGHLHMIYRGRHGDSASTGNATVKADAAESPQAIESRAVFVMDRRSGKLLWSAAAQGRFRHNAICAGGGRLYAVDRDAASPGGARLAAFDLATGKELWSRKQGVFGTFLSYSAKHDVLLESGCPSADSLHDEARGMRAYRAAEGRELWYDAAAAGPPLIHGDWVLRNFGACLVADGTPLLINDPLTGAPRPWRWTRAHGCNLPAGSESLLTFRSGAAGFYDLARFGGTGNWGGFRSSCTNNLVIAGGLVTAPDYTRTCTCSYQNQTSLALVPDGEAESWTMQGSPVESDRPIQRLGVNLGAPGNRVDDQGTLWIEYPRIADAALHSANAWPQIEVTPGAKAAYFRQHASVVTGPLPWVCASGAVGLESLRVTLGGHSAERHRYTVRLYFAEPEELRPGDRPLSVSLQGHEVLHGFDITREAGGPHRGLVKQFTGIMVEDQLVVTLKPSGSRPTILCGLEITADTAGGTLAKLHDALPSDGGSRQ
ncbi:MAG: PQQ-binding-like beta-propeller repeat protein [Thermoguttaceae bacterium]|jgi:outer membrane protein assembly factor BamB